MRKTYPFYSVFCHLLACVFICFSGLSQAQEINLADPEQTVLRIGVKEAPPFVMYDGTKYSGLSIDLWQEIADEHGWKFEYQPYSLTELLDAASSGKVTASITSALTVGQLSNKLSSADDLKGMNIASLNGSTSALWLKSRKLNYNTAENLSQALQQLKEGKVDAVIYDEPLLRWTIKQEFSGKLQVLPITLARQDYVFILPDNSTIREQINASLLSRINSPNWPQRVSNYFDGN